MEEKSLEPSPVIFALFEPSWGFPFGYLVVESEGGKSLCGDAHNKFKKIRYLLAYDFNYTSEDVFETQT